MLSIPGQHTAAEAFDGVVCFGGEDWWYHNRGHYDMRMMRQISARLPVLYVNSIGMRVPNPGEGRMFVARVRRKLRSVRRGLVRVTDRFAVYSPVVMPSRLGLRLTRPLMLRGVRRAAARLGISRPLLWVACPTGAEAVEALDPAPAALVYQRTDRYECFSGVDAARIRRYDSWLKARADLTVFCSKSLYDDEYAACRRSAWVDHGVDLERFAAAADAPAPPAARPADVEQLPRPLVGFIGAIDAHTFDPDLLLEVARRLPDAHFLLVGPCSLMPEWCERPNVTLLGQRPYEEVPRYMAACDALIMPWLRSPWIEACNPVKLKEYLATGRPIVSTGFAELRRYEGLVRVADTPEAFAEQVRRALSEPFDPAPGRKRVAAESWTSRLEAVLDELAAVSIRPADRSHRRAPATAAAPRVPAGLVPAALRRAAAAPGSTPPEAPGVDLVACIVLAGGLRPSPLVAATGLSTLDLWLTPERTVLGWWAERFEEIARHLGRPVEIRVAHDAIHPPPWPAAGGTAAGTGGAVTIEQDPRPLRGTAGVVADLCRGYAPHQVVLVAEGARFLDATLLPMLAEHAAHGADVTVAANADGTPAGVYLLGVATLDLVPGLGFMDLKEQWLRRAVDAGRRVRVHNLPRGAAGRPLRTREDLLVAARQANRVAGNTELRVICAGALIGPGAAVVDSIVMPGAVVAPGTVVVRSLVCPDSQTQAGTDLVDAIVPAGGPVETAAPPASHGGRGA